MLSIVIRNQVDKFAKFELFLNLGRLPIIVVINVVKDITTSFISYMCAIHKLGELCCWIHLIGMLLIDLNLIFKV